MKKEAAQSSKDQSSKGESAGQRTTRSGKPIQPPQLKEVKKEEPPAQLLPKKRLREESKEKAKSDSKETKETIKEIKQEKDKKKEVSAAHVKVEAAKDIKEHKETTAKGKKKEEKNEQKENAVIEKAEKHSKREDKNDKKIEHQLKQEAKEESKHGFKEEKANTKKDKDNDTQHNIKQEAVPVQQKEQPLVKKEEPAAQASADAFKSATQAANIKKEEQVPQHPFALSRQEQTFDDQDDMNMKDDDSAGDDDDPDRKKQKRRSKNDVQGRDHKCNYCDKTYLSYPALYTHMKNKHAKGPDGQPLININSGRGRGRPKKNATGVRFPQADPTSDEYFKTNEKTGGPIDPTSGFREVYTEIYIKRAKIQDRRQEESNVMEGEQTEDKKMEGEGEEQSNIDNTNMKQEDEKENIEEEKIGNTCGEDSKQQEQPSSSNNNPPEKIKKKRGRKPKSFYLQQQLEQEKMAKEQLEKRKQEMQEAENEEEVKLRVDEFKQHPLFSRLSIYADELKDYIEEKRKIQQQKLLELQKEQERKEAQSSYPDIKGGNIFCTQKVINNNTNLKNQPQITTTQPLKPIIKTDTKQEEKKEDKKDYDSSEGEEDEEMQEKKEIEQEEQRMKEKEEELKKDDRMRKFISMSEIDKDNLTCDEVFSMYLRYVSKQVNENYYRNCLRFVLLYRECLNEYGWLKRRDHYQKAGLLDADEIINRLKKEEEKEEEQQKIKDQQSQLDVQNDIKVEKIQNPENIKEKKEEIKVNHTEQSEETKHQQEDTEMNEENKQKEDSEKQEEQLNQDEEEDIYIPQAEYTAVCNGDFIPLICNEFVTEFLDKEHGACSLDRNEAIDLTRNFCYWVASNGLTCAHISLYQ